MSSKNARDALTDFCLTVDERGNYIKLSAAQAAAIIDHLEAAEIEVKDRRPIGKQVHDWLQDDANRENLRKMLARFDENFRMNSGTRGPTP